MLVMTAKVDKKKIILVLAAAAALILLLSLIFGSGKDTATAAPSLATNDGRLAFLQSFGWEAAASPVESGQVRIPETQGDTFGRYNALQKSQGYDLTPYAGKTVMRYVYKLKNYPNATDPVYATLLIHKDQIIGGDINDTSANGKIHGFQMPSVQQSPQATAPSVIPGVS